MPKVYKPSLFGIKHSNRDYNSLEAWGKNQFNSSFPTALSCYLYKKQMPAVYIKADKRLNSQVSYIEVDKLFKIDPSSDDVYFSFESQFIPYQRFICGNVPRNDLVVINRKNDACISSFEIKLTALPDNSTCELDEQAYGSEIVVRPDTIIYLACSIIKKFSSRLNDLKDILYFSGDDQLDWSQAIYVLPHIATIRKSIEEIVELKNRVQNPIIIQPIWKTKGKSPKLAKNCLDVFVWSDFGMLNLFLPEKNSSLSSISRHTRSMIWLYKMMLDYTKYGHFDCMKIIDELSYNTKNDKAFSTNGVRTHHLMSCKELINPRITKAEIKNIILGGGQNLLSPERRFDAIIYNSPELFD